jgi:ASC-1-like (ASCH) protein
MYHIAIMKKSWKLTKKVLKGTKTIESRWYLHKYAPWGRITVGDTIFFKNSGEPVKLQATVGKILSFDNLTPNMVYKILLTYSKEDGIEEKEIPVFYERFKDKKYCLLIFLKSVEKIEPFDINKKGFGKMAAWISTDNLKKIKRPSVS